MCVGNDVHRVATYYHLSVTLLGRVLVHLQSIFACMVQACWQSQCGVRCCTGMFCRHERFTIVFSPPFELFPPFF